MLSAIGDGFSNLLNSSTSILDIVKQGFTNITTAISGMWESITQIPSKIVEGLKDALTWLFVPEDNFFNDKVEEFKTKLNEKIPYQQYLESFEEIESITDLTGDTDEITTSIDMGEYTITDNLTISMQNFIDFSIFTKYKETWYSWVRVVTYIGLVIYNINQVVKMFNGFGALEGSFVDLTKTTRSGGGD